MKVTYAPFDAAAYLDSERVVAEYLTAAAEDPNPAVFLAALSNVARARGVARIAEEAGLGRESLYKALGAGAHPRYETVAAVLRALGVKLTVAPSLRPRRAISRRKASRPQASTRDRESRARRTMT